MSSDASAPHALDVAGGDHDVGPELGEGGDDVAAVQPRAAGDDGDLAGQVEQLRHRSWLPAPSTCRTVPIHQ